jgi:phage shock protein A
MASIFQRLFKFGQSEAHSVIDQFEDPIKMTEQGIRDLKRDLQSSMTSLAEVKAIAIRMRKDVDDNKSMAAEYERKAMLLLQKMQKGEVDQAEAERLASEALRRKEECTEKATQTTKTWETQDTMASQLQGQIEKLKSTVSKYENDLITLRARAKTAASTKKINQQLSKIDSSGTIALLEKMRDKVEEDESLAQAYGSLANADQTVEDEIENALAANTTPSTNDALAELKAKMGITSAG